MYKVQRACRAHVDDTADLGVSCLLCNDLTCFKECRFTAEEPDEGHHKKLHIQKDQKRVIKGHSKVGV